MGKKRIISKEGKEEVKSGEAKSVSTLQKKKNVSGILNIQATFNNTKVSLADKAGNVLCWSSSGSMGFKGAKKGTPFASSKVGEVLGEKAKNMGIKEVDVVITGVGPGREPAMRSFAAYGIEINSIKDTTPIPHNGPKPKKPRRV